MQEIAPSRAQTAWSPSGALAERPRILDPGDCRVETECTSTIALVHVEQHTESIRSGKKDHPDAAGLRNAGTMVAVARAGDGEA